MTDDVKAAVEWLRDVADNGAWRSESARALLAHIDGEPARTAAAVAAAREEQREADRQWALKHPDHFGWRIEMLSESPLTETPLADRIAELEREAHSLRVTAQDAIERRDSLMRRCERMDAKQDAEEKALKVRTEKAEAERDEVEAERDALATKVAELEADRDDTAAELFHAYQRNEAIEIEAQSLRAQVEAARAEGEAIRCGSDCDSSSCYDSECHAARLILAAMDRAKP